MSGLFAKGGQSKSRLLADSPQRKRMLARTGAGYGTGASRNRATCEDGITIVRDLLASAVNLVIATRTARSYSESTPRCHLDALSKPSLRCEPSATRAFII